MVRMVGVCYSLSNKVMSRLLNSGGLMRTKITAIAAISVALVIPSVPAHAVDLSNYTTDAALCRQIGKESYSPNADGYEAWRSMDIPGVWEKTNFACGPDIKLNKPAPPTDGKNVVVNTGLGAVGIPCDFDLNAQVFNGESQFGYIGLPNTIFPSANLFGTWQDRKTHFEARERSEYRGPGVFVATQPGTFSFTGEFKNPLDSQVVKCNVTVNVSDKPASSTPSERDSARCVSAKANLSKAQKAKKPKKVAAARKTVQRFCLP